MRRRNFALEAPDGRRGLAEAVDETRLLARQRRVLVLDLVADAASHFSLDAQVRHLKQEIMVRDAGPGARNARARLEFLPPLPHNSISDLGGSRLFAGRCGAAG